MNLKMTFFAIGTLLIASQAEAMMNRALGGSITHRTITRLQQMQQKLSRANYSKSKKTPEEKMALQNKLNADKSRNTVMKMAAGCIVGSATALPGGYVCGLPLSLISADGREGFVMSNLLFGTLGGSMFGPLGALGGFAGGILVSAMDK